MPITIGRRPDHGREASCCAFRRLEMKMIPLNPPHPERICWGCDKYCPADDLRCGNGTVRTMHPCELFGDDWFSWKVEPNHSGQPDSPGSQEPLEMNGGDANIVDDIADLDRR